jgi:hypothetical protein
MARGWILLVLLLALLAAACGGDGSSGPSSGEQATEEGGGGDEPVPVLDETPVTDLSPEEQTAVQGVLDNIAETAGEDAQELSVLFIESQEWPDGCLGLAGPDEGCTFAIVPGYRIVVGQPGGLAFIYRTNFDGSVVRFESLRTATQE